MKCDPSTFIEEIYDLEAAGMLADLALGSRLFLNFMELDEFGTNKALVYIKSVLAECYKTGEMQVAIANNDTELHGYAILFTHPNQTFSKYLHKIYVKEKYRGMGTGTGLLATTTSKDSRVCLLCPSDKISFYEQHGFNFGGQFESYKNDSFELSGGLYSDLYVMRNYTESLDTPVFLLNDKDVKEIFAL